MTGVAGQARRGRRWLIPYLLLGAMSVGALVAAWGSSGASSLTSSVGPEGVTVFDVADVAPASSTAHGQPIDGLTCQTPATEVVKYHVHVHVSLYVDGQMERLPAGIGITAPPVITRSARGDFYDAGASDCLYWLHTHVADGIIHVEAPARHDFTLGQFFDVWNQPLSATRVGPARGAVVVFENGQRLSGDPRDTPLRPQGQIQIDVGSPVVAFRSSPYRVTGGCGEGTNSCASPIG